jgi:4-hydroxybenzoate polyprenyltransferase
MVYHSHIEPEDLSHKPPLVLDLDHTLIHTDILHETALAYVKGNPLSIFKLLGWLLRGKAWFKRRLTSAMPANVDMLPVNEALVAYARSQNAGGREVVLATAADDLVARRIAKRFDFIDNVIASDGVTNLKGAAKAERLIELYPAGFSYAGDCQADLPVWQAAKTAILVNPSSKLKAQAERLTEIEQVFDDRASGSTILRAMRVHQWAKNLLVFVPLVLGGLVASPPAWISSVVAFLALSLLASATYLINDLWDLQDDRQHWTKRDRPIASGRLSVQAAAGLAGGLLISGFALAAVLSPAVIGLLGLYLLVTLCYSLGLKRQPVVDVFVLASLFTFRLALGIAASGAAFSAWLMVFSMFLFASLSFAKRYTEIERNGRNGGNALAGRGYIAKDAALVQTMGMACGMGAVLIMVLYLINDAFQASFYVHQDWLWTFPVILFLWIGRVWTVCLRGEMHDDPVTFALKDKTSLVHGGLIAAAFLVAWAGLPLWAVTG